MYYSVHLFEDFQDADIYGDSAGAIDANSFGVVSAQRLFLAFVHQEIPIFAAVVLAICCIDSAVVTCSAVLVVAEGCH